MGIGNHQSPKMKTDEWLTPPEIVNALGPFDLDPCSPIIRPWDTAKTHFSLPTELFQPDGLSRDWSPYGRIWLNPPYGQQTGKWMMKLSYHNNGIALIFARTETKIFFDHVWYKADSILFIKGRLEFYFVDGTKSTGGSGAPSCLIAYGKNNSDILKTSSIEGKFLYLGQE